MLQFLKFWWDCLLYGWKIGYGIVFNSIEGTCVLILALLLWRRKAHAKAKQWEEPVMKLAGLLLVAAFVMSSVLVAPVVKTIELEATREAATRDVASWSNRYLLLQEKNERRGSPSSVLDSNLLTRVERSASRIDEAARRQERFVVEAAKGNDE